MDTHAPIAPLTRPALAATALAQTTSVATALAGPRSPRATTTERSREYDTADSFPGRPITLQWLGRPDAAMAAGLSRLVRAAIDAIPELTVPGGVRSGSVLVLLTAGIIAGTGRIRLAWEAAPGIAAHRGFAVVAGETAPLAATDFGERSELRAIGAWVAPT